MENLEFLKTLTTKRLLSYYKAERKRRKLYSYHPNYPYLTEKEWDTHLEEVKKLLDGREHIEKDFICGGKDTTYNNLMKRVKKLKHGQE